MTSQIDPDHFFSREMRNAAAASNAERRRSPPVSAGLTGARRRRPISAKLFGEEIARSANSMPEYSTK
jgi:hypothetical protein